MPSGTWSPAVVAGLLSLSIAAGACASRGSAGSGTASSPNGKVVQVTMADSGRVVTLHVGDTLRILLGPPTGQAFLTWQLRTYPKDVLTPLPKSQAREQFDLLAASEGKGTVSLVGMVRCSSPGPMVGAAVQCPVLGAGGNTAGEPSPTVSSGAPGGMPARLLEFDITVTS